MSDWNARVAVVISTPLAKVTGPGGNLIFDPISPLWHRARMSLSLGTNINTSEICADGLEVGDARSQVAARCLSMNPLPGYLFFIDSDVIVPPDAFTKLFHHLKTKPHIDVAAGVYVVKGTPPYDPLIYQENGEGAFWDWAVGDILTTKQHNIRAVHMGLTLIRVNLFQRMKDAGLVGGDGTEQDNEPFFCTEKYSKETPRGRETFAGTEDIYFFAKARKLPGGCQILVDTSVLAGHHDKKTGISYGMVGNCTPIERAEWLPLPDGSGLRKDRKKAMDHEVVCECVHPVFEPGDNVDYVKGKKYARADCPKCNGRGFLTKPLLLAIDLGAGDSRREWPGYKTYTLDAYRDSKCDYTQELPRLNLPDDHYDLVASRHSFEHVGRWQQELLWSEAFRICRPGGKLEVIVPSLQWACEKVAAGQVDFHVLNVLYGSQELEEGWGTEGNHHLFGYTKEVAVALAEKAGFVDVKCKDWRDDPEMDYHMTITASKPSAPPPEKAMHRCYKHQGAEGETQEQIDRRAETRLCHCPTNGVSHADAGSDRPAAVAGPAPDAGDGRDADGGNGHGVGEPLRREGAGVAAGGEGEGAHAQEG